MYYSKYHAKKTKVGDITFDSKKEADRYIVLKKMEEDNFIENLRLQVPYVLIEKSMGGRAIVYKADFVYFDTDLREEVVEDVKGFITPEYKLKKRLMYEKYGIIIKET